MNQDFPLRQCHVNGGVHSLAANINGFALWASKASRRPVCGTELEPDAQRSRASHALFGVFVTHRFASTRLAVDPATVSHCCILVHTGRIDNRDELAGLLEDPTIAGANDRVVLAACYEAWGATFASRVMGEYAFALIDRRDGSLVAGRDSLGIHKLVYYDDGQRVWVASGLDMLLSVLPELPGHDRDALCDFLGSGAVLDRSGRTFYKAVSHLAPAHVLTLSGDQRDLRTTRYWEPDLTASLSFADASEYVSEFRRLVFNSVRAALRGDGPICLELSGGLDSSGVTSVALSLRDSGLTSAELLAYTLTGSSTLRTDEPGYWKSVVSRYPVEHHAIDIDAIPSRWKFDRAQPTFADGQPWLLDAQEELALSRGPRICLTGHGGDALFGLALPPLHLAESLKRFAIGTWWHELLSWTRGDKYSMWDLVSIYSRGELMKAFGGPPSIPVWLHPAHRDRVKAAQRFVFTGGLSKRISNHRLFQYHLVSSVSANLPDQQYLPWNMRCPLLARPLVEFMLAVPPELKTAPNGNRVLQRRALEGILPEPVRLRRNKADFTPRFFRGMRQNWDYWAPLSVGTHLADLGLVEPRGFQSSCERLRDGQPDNDLSFFLPALLLEGWLSARPS